MVTVCQSGAHDTDLPRTETLHFYEPESGGDHVEFRLIYRGSLPAQGAGGNRTREKHLIRKQLHGQLRELWRQHPRLRFFSEQKFIVQGDRVRPDLGHLDEPSKPWIEHIADNYERCGGRFVPLVRKRSGFTCSLDILFLRRDNPGNLIRSGGDIDNRVKVLFDGLKIPSTMDDLGGWPIEEYENPFFCLLEDDSLITSVTITTDRLLMPQETDEKEHDVVLVARVTVLDPSALFGPTGLI